MTMPVVIVMLRVVMVLVVAAMCGMPAALVHGPEALVRPWSVMHPRTMAAQAVTPVPAAARQGVVAASNEAGTADDQDPDKRSREHGASPGVVLPVAPS